MFRYMEKYLTALWRMDCNKVTLRMRFKRLLQKFTEEVMTDMSKSHIAEG